MANADWTSTGKTVAGLIKELQSFEDQTLEVRISFDDGATSLPISLVTKARCEGKPFAVLQNSQDEPAAIRHID